MTNPLGAADFFALEAGECLDRLETLVQGSSPTVRRGVPPHGPSASRLRAHGRPAAHRESRGRIGSLARSNRDHRRAWDSATREHVAQSVEEFRLLVRRAREWNEADTARRRPAQAISRP